MIQLSAKLSLLDRALGIYGPETGDVRGHLRAATEEIVSDLWPENSGVQPALHPESEAGTSVYIAIHSLAPRDDTQRTLKTQSLTLSAQIGELRALLIAQSVSYISRPLLVVLIAWLVVVFLTFSVLAPRNVTALTILIISSLSISGAIFLILERDRPFSGLIRIPSEPLRRGLSNMGK